MYWGKLISVTGAAQIIIQGLGFVSGILVLRLLSVDEYAYYTLANTMLGAMTVLADGGISIGVMSQGGKVWDNKEKLGGVLVTGLNLRKKFAIGSLIVCLPILASQLWQHNASWLMIALTVASLIPAFYAALSGSLLEIIPKLRQDVVPLQKNQIVVSVLRALLTAAFIFVFPFTFIALLANGIPRIYGNIKLLKIVSPFADTSQSIDPVVNKEILSVVKRALPEIIYYCFSSQITVWIITYFGNTKSVAEIGALSRLAALLTIFNVILSTLVIPRFAKLPQQKDILFKHFFQISAAIIFILLIFITGIFCFSKEILWILGDKYAGLELELFLSVLGACINLIAGIIFNLYTSRGWVMNPLLAIISSISAILIGVFIFDIKTLKGVLIFNIYLSIIQFFLQSMYLLYKVSKVDKDIISHS